jgi:hypothetical protein
VRIVPFLLAVLVVEHHEAAGERDVITVLPWHSLPHWFAASTSAKTADRIAFGSVGHATVTPPG